jgi:serine/threonine protein kinase
VILTHTFLFPGSTSQEIYEKNRGFSFDLNHEKYNKVNPQARDLLKLMLELDYRERITAFDSLEHSFLDENQLPYVKEIDLTELADSSSFCHNYLF